MDRDELLKSLTILDFTALDLHLYLDTHTHDSEAIAKYNDALSQANKCRMQYERLYGPLCSYRSPSKETFDWVDDPWPWQEQSNFEIIGEGR